MIFRGGKISTGEMGNFHPALTHGAIGRIDSNIQAYSHIYALLLEISFKI